MSEMVARERIAAQQEADWQVDATAVVGLFQAIFVRAQPTGGHIELMSGSIDVAFTMGETLDERLLQVDHLYMSGDGVSSDGRPTERALATKYVLRAGDMAETRADGFKLERLVPISVTALTSDRSAEHRLACELAFRLAQQADSEGLEGVVDAELARQALGERIDSIRRQKAALVARRGCAAPPPSQHLTSLEVSHTRRLRELLEEAAACQAEQNAVAMKRREQD